MSHNQVQTQTLILQILMHMGSQRWSCLSTQIGLDPLEV